MLPHDSDMQQPLFEGECHCQCPRDKIIRVNVPKTRVHYFPIDDQELEDAHRAIEGSPPNVEEISDDDAAAVHQQQDPMEGEMEAEEKLTDAGAGAGAADDVWDQEMDGMSGSLTHEGDSGISIDPTDHGMSAQH